MDHLLKAKKEHKNSKETGDSRYIYQNELDKSCCEHDMIYGDLNDLPRRTVLINYYVIKHLILLKIQNMMDIKEVLLQKFINFSIKNLLALILQLVLLKVK